MVVWFILTTPARGATNPRPGAWYTTLDDLPTEECYGAHRSAGQVGWPVQVWTILDADGTPVLDGAGPTPPEKRALIEAAMALVRD